MEDILNFLKNRPSVEIDEDVEYFQEKTDLKTNQKFYRFFQFSCNINSLSNKYFSLIDKMGRPAKHSLVGQGDHPG